MTNLEASLLRNLKAARNRKESLEASIKRSEAVINQNDKNIDGKPNSETWKRGSEDLEIRLTTKDKIDAEIDRKVNRINFEKKKIAPKTSLMILTDQPFEGLVLTTENEIDRHYCYGEGVFQVEKTGGVAVYIVKGERFGDHIHNADGKSVKVSTTRGDVHSRRVDVLGAAFTNKYGYPFAGNLGGNDLSFKNDFTCLNPSAARHHLCH